MRFDGYDINYAEDTMNYTYVGARKCDREKDFGRNKETRKFFDKWNIGYSLICPDITNNETLVLKGLESDTIQQNFEFKVMKCNSTLRGQKDGSKEYPDDDVYNEFINRTLNNITCANSTEIDKYIRDVEI